MRTTTHTSRRFTAWYAMATACALSLTGCGSSDSDTSAASGQPEQSGSSAERSPDPDGAAPGPSDPAPSDTASSQLASTDSSTGGSGSGRMESAPSGGSDSSAGVTESAPQPSVPEPSGAGPSTFASSPAGQADGAGAPASSQQPGADGLAIEAIPCDGGAYLGTFLTVDVREAERTFTELEQQYQGAAFGHLSAPCGPEDQVLAYWAGPGEETTSTLLTKRRTIDRPQVVVAQMDPKRPGYLQTGLCALTEDGGQPRLIAGKPLSSNDKQWLFELTDYLGRSGLIHPDQAGVTTMDAMVVSGIKSFQKGSGIEADGVAGPDTWRALTGKLCKDGAAELQPMSG